MKIKTFYGLPRKVIFCKKTLISNQRPNSTIEFKHTIRSKKKTLKIDKRGISDSWKFSRMKYLKKKKQILKTILSPVTQLRNLMSALIFKLTRK